MKTTNADVKAPETPKAKRKYKSLGNTEFIAIANTCENVREVAEKTGMSLAGVAFKIKRLLPGKKIKKSLYTPRTPK